MAADDLEEGYHLTPNGWVKGTSWFFGGIQGEEKAAPGDRLLTIKRRTYQSFIYSRESITVQEVWRAKDAANQILALKKKFPLTHYC